MIACHKPVLSNGPAFLSNRAGLRNGIVPHGTPSDQRERNRSSKAIRQTFT